MLRKWLVAIINKHGETSLNKARQNSFKGPIIWPAGEGLRYLEDGKSMLILSEMIWGVCHVSAKSIDRWEGEFASMPISDVQKRRILQYVVNHIEKEGVKVVVEDSQDWLDE